MIVHKNIEQGTQAWHSLRAGIPTSSEFGNIITPVTGALSASAEGYAEIKAIEIMLKENIVNDFANEYMERGKVLENQAADQYELIYNVDTEVVGFVTDDKGHYGCSPDRMIPSDNGGLEIKCLGITKHAHHIFSEEIDKVHKPQIMGQMLIAELDYVDYWMYHPSLPPVRVKTVRDDSYIAKLEKHLITFREMLADKVDVLIKKGLIEV